MAWLKGLAATAAVAAAAAGVMFYHLFNLPNERGTEVQLLIEKGAGSRRVAEQLAEAGVISHPLLFRLAARVSGLDKDLKAGNMFFCRVFRCAKFWRSSAAAKCITAG